MSIATTESPATLRALSRRDAESDAREATEEGVKLEIAQAFALLRTMPSKQIAVPTVEYRNGNVRATGISMEEALRDLTTDGAAMRQLLFILNDSECPLVQRYRDALCHEWQRRWAADVAEARS